MKVHVGHPFLFNMEGMKLIMSDRLVRFLSHVDMVKVTCVDSTELVEKARKIHKLNPTPTAALGRTLTMAVIIMVGKFKKMR